VLGFCKVQELSPPNRPNRHVWRLFRSTSWKLDAPTRLAQEWSMNSWPNDTVSKVRRHSDSVRFRFREILECIP